MIPGDLVAPLAALKARRPDAPLDVRWHATLPSTMDTASSLVHDGAAHGVVVVADAQTAGRGRRGSSWASPPGAGLYFSFVARPPGVDATGLSLLTLAAGVAVRDGISSATGLAPDLKWPNDLIVGRRKLAGILAEGIAIGTAGQSVIVGVGLNLQPAAYPPDVSIRATSIEGELGRPVERGQVFAEILISLWDRLAQLAQSPGDILQAWRRGSPNAIGTQVEWDGRQGVTAGIDDTGALLVNTAGRTERIIAGELRWML
ncbi:MAG TPA: biotin--[acetyl-CoA-carboxylase] ligase [Vicinamibacterales bacterium]|jgi:BirA family biotin operon repressor/biotin-[acetyl-CoA-carboxylase] ligase